MFFSTPPPTHFQKSWLRRRRRVRHEHHVVNARSDFTTDFLRCERTDVIFVTHAIHTWPFWTGVKKFGVETQTAKITGPHWSGGGRVFFVFSVRPSRVSPFPTGRADGTCVQRRSRRSCAGGRSRRSGWKTMTSSSSSNRPAGTNS